VQNFHDLPLENIPEFQSFVYQEWGEVEVRVEEINEHVTNRKYIGFCEGCGDECLLGIIKMVDDEPANLYVPVDRLH
jgi:hypothetical protein